MKSVSCKDKVIKITQTHPHNQGPQGFLVNEQHDLHDDPETLVISSFGKLAYKCPRGGKGDMDFAEGKHVSEGNSEWNPADGYDEVECRHRGWFRDIWKLSEAKVRGCRLAPRECWDGLLFLKYCTSTGTDIRYLLNVLSRHQVSALEAIRSTSLLLYKLCRTESIPPSTNLGTKVIMVDVVTILLSHEFPAKLPGSSLRAGFSAASIQVSSISTPTACQQLQYPPTEASHDVMERFEVGIQGNW